MVVITTEINHINVCFCLFQVWLLCFFLNGDNMIFCAPLCARFQISFYAQWSLLIFSTINPGLTEAHILTPPPLSPFSVQELCPSLHQHQQWAPDQVFTPAMPPELMDISYHIWMLQKLNMNQANNYGKMDFNVLDFSRCRHMGQPSVPESFSL